MSAEIIYGTDFKRSNPKADYNEMLIARIVGVPSQTSTDLDPSNPNIQPDTAPSEMNMDEGA
jgi:hypothetical protein